MSQGIILDNISFGYNKKEFILKNISLTINPGDFIGIIGINGSGKSTITTLLNGLIPNIIKGKFVGKITIDGIDTRTESVSFFAKKVGLLFQNPDFSLFNLTVEEEIAFGIKNLGLKNINSKIQQALEKVQMQTYIKKNPQALSLGEKQKICLASILALDTKYIVLDEPVAMLDYKSSLDIYKILNQLNKENKTIITVEHDTDLLWQFAKKILVIDSGEIIAFDNTKNILTNKQLLQKLGLKIPNIQRSF